MSTSSIKSFFFASLSSNSQVLGGTNSSLTPDEKEHIAQTHASDNPIKGIHVRLRHTQGVVILAFYDLRDASKVNALFDNGFQEILELSVDRDATVVDETEDKGADCAWDKGLSCRFIEIDELVKVCLIIKFISIVTYFPLARRSFVFRHRNRRGILYFLF